MSKNLRSLNKTAALRKRRGRDQGNQVEPPPPVRFFPEEDGST